MGALLARNWLNARDRLIELHQRGSPTRSWTRHIINPALQLLGIAWIPLGILALVRGGTSLH